MQITSEQTDWLTKFLGRNLPAVTPEMAVNTAGDMPASGGEAPAPGLLERFDGAVNDFGAVVFGSAGRMPAPGASAVPAPEAALPSAVAQPAAPQPGLFERIDTAVNEFGASIFGSAGRMPRPSTLPIAAPEAPPASAPAQSATAEPGLLDRIDAAVNEFGASIFGSVGRVD